MIHLRGEDLEVLSHCLITGQNSIIVPSCCGLSSYFSFVMHCSFCGLANSSSSETQGQSVGRKGGTNVFMYGRKRPWIPTATELFPKIQADAGSWLGTKNALYYCAESANSFSWVLFVSSYATAIVSPHLPGSFIKLVRARESLFSTFLTRNEGTTDKSKRH